MRVVSRSDVVSRRSRWFGYSGVSLVKSGPLPGVLDGTAVDGVETDQRVELLPLVGLLAVLGNADRAGDGVAAAQAVLTHHVHRHVDVVGTGEITRGTDERVVVEHVEDARDGLDDVVLAQLGLAVAALTTGAVTAAPAIAEAPAPASLAAFAVVVVVVVVAVVVVATLLVAALVALLIALLLVTTVLLGVLLILVLSVFLSVFLSFLSWLAPSVASWPPSCLLRSPAAPVSREALRRSRRC